MEENKNIISFSVSYETERELYTHVIKLYNLVCDKKITKREIPFVVSYLKYGYSKETKDMLTSELGVNSNDIDVLNFNLRKKGILIQNKYNKHNSFLCDDILTLKNFVEGTGSLKVIPIVFKEKSYEFNEDSN